MRSRAANGRRGVAILLMPVLVCIALLGVAGCSESKELVSAIRSPNGTWEARQYYLNPGAAASSHDSVEVVNTDSGKSREVWFGPPDVGEPKWLDDNTLIVGEQTLDVRKDKYDWYEDASSEGYGTPEAAADAFIEGVALRNGAQARRASRPIVTDDDLAALRKRLFKTESAIELGDMKMVRDPSITASDQREYIATLDFLVEGAQRSVKLQELVTQESGKWQVEWLEPEGTF